MTYYFQPHTPTSPYPPCLPPHPMGKFFCLCGSCPAAAMWVSPGIKTSTLTFFSLSLSFSQCTTANLCSFIHRLLQPSPPQPVPSCSAGSELRWQYRLVSLKGEKKTVSPPDLPEGKCTAVCCSSTLLCVSLIHSCRKLLFLNFNCTTWRWWCHCTPAVEPPKM